MVKSLVLLFLVSPLWAGEFGMYRTDNLVSYYKMNEGGGSVLNDSSLVLPTTATTSGTGQAWTIGFFGKAMDLDGSGGWVAQDTDKFNFRDWTFMCWVYLKSNTGGRRRIYNQQTTSDGSIYLGMAVNDGLLEVFSEKDAVVQAGVVPIPLRRWTHCAVTRKAGTHLAIYINGKLDTKVASTNSDQYNIVSDMGIGVLARTGGELFIGSLDELVALNKALSDGEIAGEYARSLNRRTTLLQ